MLRLSRRTFPFIVKALLILDARTRLRLGRQLQALYEPVLDEVLDPLLAELMAQLDVDREHPQAD